MPTFIIPGAARAGTTTLWYCLDQHPDILMSKPKEPKVFVRKRENKINLKLYNKVFDDYAGEKAIGEASVNYMISSDETIETIYEHIPDVKIIFSLRDPMKRAVSHYWHRINERRYRGSLEELITQKGLNNFPVYYSLYNTHIQRFLKLFPRENIYISILEELNQDWDESFSEIFRFLNVDDNFRAIKHTSINRAYTRRSYPLNRFVRKMLRGYRYKKLIPQPIRDVGKAVTSKILKLNQKPFQAPPISPDVERELAEVFIPEIEGIEKLIGREITVWPTKHVLDITAVQNKFSQKKRSL